MQGCPAEIIHLSLEIGQANEKDGSYSTCALPVIYQALLWYWEFQHLKNQTL